MTDMSAIEAQKAEYVAPAETPTPVVLSFEQFTKAIQPSENAYVWDLALAAQRQAGPVGLDHTFEGFSGTYQITSSATSEQKPGMERLQKNIAEQDKKIQWLRSAIEDFRSDKQTKEARARDLKQAEILREQYNDEYIALTGLNVAKFGRFERIQIDVPLQPELEKDTDFPDLDTPVYHRQLAENQARTAEPKPDNGPTHSLAEGVIAGLAITSTVAPSAAEAVSYVNQNDFRQAEQNQDAKGTQPDVQIPEIGLEQIVPKLTDLQQEGFSPVANYNPDTGKYEVDFLIDGKVLRLSMTEQENAIFANVLAKYQPKPDQESATETPTPTGESSGSALPTEVKGEFRSYLPITDKSHPISTTTPPSATASASSTAPIIATSTASSTPRPPATATERATVEPTATASATATETPVPTPEGQIQLTGNEIVYTSPHQNAYWQTAHAFTRGENEVNYRDYSRDANEVVNRDGETGYIDDTQSQRPEDNTEGPEVFDPRTIVEPANPYTMSMGEGNHIPGYSPDLEWRPMRDGSTIVEANQAINYYFKGNVQFTDPEGVRRIYLDNMNVADAQRRMIGFEITPDNQLRFIQGLPLPSGFPTQALKRLINGDFDIGMQIDKTHKKVQIVEKGPDGEYAPMLDDNGNQIEPIDISDEVIDGRWLLVDRGRQSTLTLNSVVNERGQTALEPDQVLPEHEIGSGLAAKLEIPVLLQLDGINPGTEEFYIKVKEASEAINYFNPSLGDRRVPIEIPDSYREFAEFISSIGIKAPTLIETGINMFPRWLRPAEAEELIRLLIQTSPNQDVILTIAEKDGKFFLNENVLSNPNDPKAAFNTLVQWIRIMNTEGLASIDADPLMLDEKGLSPAQDEIRKVDLRLDRVKLENIPVKELIDLKSKGLVLNRLFFDTSIWDPQKLQERIRDDREFRELLSLYEIGICNLAEVNQEEANFWGYLATIEEQEAMHEMMDGKAIEPDPPSSLHASAFTSDPQTRRLLRNHNNNDIYKRIINAFSKRN